MKLNSRRQVFLRYGANLKIPYKNGKGEERSTEFKIQETLARVSKFNVKPAIPFETFYYSLRTKSNLGASCTVCGEKDGVEMHHIKSLKQGKTANTFAQIMVNMQR